MKTLLTFILTVSISGYVIAQSVEKFQDVRSDYLKSSLCIKEKIALGAERSQIVVIGSTCYTK